MMLTTKQTQETNIHVPNRQSHESSSLNSATAGICSPFHYKLRIISSVGNVISFKMYNMDMQMIVKFQFISKIHWQYFYVFWEPSIQKFVLEYCFLVCYVHYTSTVRRFCVAFLMWLSGVACLSSTKKQFISNLKFYRILQVIFISSVRWISPVTGLEWPRRLQEVKGPRLHDNGTGWVVRFSALRTGRL